MSKMKDDRFKRFIYMKFGLFSFTLILLMVLLIHLILSYEAAFDPNLLLNLTIIIISVLIAGILSITIFELITIKEYQNYFIKRRYIKKGKSYLTLSDIFENENRIKILTQILNNPGIHQNQILRNCDLQKGQLQWHLDVLLKNHIIKKEKHGQYNLYFPITSSVESIEMLKKFPIKSETTSEILDLIKKNPGISSSEISIKLNLARNTVKYHIDKLSEKNLISLKEKGRKIEIFPNLENLNS